MNAFEKLSSCLASIRKQTDFAPEVALILGSGLGEFAKKINAVKVIEYSSIKGFPVSTVSGHAGRLVLGYIGKTAVAAMQGRVHYYEGNSMEDVVLPLRVLRMMGAKTLILTNAAGGINTEYRAGDFMLLSDHISSLVPSPLIGANIDELGVRFPDMTHIYDEELRQKALDIAAREKITLHTGVYLQTTGPQYESPAEIKMYRAWGADAVGMSTACEAIAARHAGYKICGISLISNAAAGITGAALTHEEVKQAADLAAIKFSKLIEALITEM